MSNHLRPRRHLRDVATICTATITLSNGQVLNRCELDAGHLEQGEKHRDGCTRWGAPVQVGGDTRGSHGAHSDA
jgi:hypothetical protein